MSLISQLLLQKLTQSKVFLFNIFYTGTRRFLSSFYLIKIFAKKDIKIVKIEKQNSTGILVIKPSMTEQFRNRRREINKP